MHLVKCVGDKVEAPKGESLSLREGSKGEMPDRVGDEVQGAKADALAQDESTGKEIRSHSDPISSTLTPT
jgi:hypothetical protein